MSDNLHAWVVNPKTGELFAAFAAKRGDVKVLAVDDELVAQGTIRSYGREYNRCEASTDYTRAHTVEGVISKPRRGTGIGTALYTSLVCAAYYADALGIRVRVTGEGICSSKYSRSKLADEWWDRAITRYKIASNNSEKDDFECEDYDRCYGLNSCDTYGYDSAVRAGLIVMLATSRTDSFTNSIIGSGADDFDVVSATSLAALNTGMIRATFGETRTEEAFMLMALLDESAKVAKVSPRDREAMRTRFLAGVDGHEPVTGLEGTMARENPGRKNRRTPEGVRRTPKGYVVTRYGSIRSNPEEPASVNAAVERAVDLRKKLGWGPWMDEAYSP